MRVQCSTTKIRKKAINFVQNKNHHFSNGSRFLISRIRKESNLEMCANKNVLRILCYAIKLKMNMPFLVTKF